MFKLFRIGYEGLLLVFGRVLLLLVGGAGGRLDDVGNLGQDDLGAHGRALVVTARLVLLGLVGEGHPLISCRNTAKVGRGPFVHELAFLLFLMGSWS